MKLDLTSTQVSSKTATKGGMSAPAPSNSDVGKDKATTGLSASRLKQFQELKTRIHRKMVDRLDLSTLEGLGGESLQL